MTFAFPALLTGAIVAGGPILIHLLLRPRPRRQVFPALRLLRVCHSASSRRRSVAQWLVLILRTLLILAIIAAAARPLLPSAGRTAVGTGGPVCAILCVDDSASMSYRTGDQTRLDRAWRTARELTDDLRRLPVGSRLFLLTGSGHRSTGWHDSAASFWRSAPRGQPPPHDRDVFRMLREAVRVSADAPLETRVVYLFTDLSVRAFEGAWDAAPPGTVVPPIQVIDLGSDANDNAGLRVSRDNGTGANWQVASGLPIRMNVTVAAGHQPVDGQIDIWIDGVLSTRSAPIHVEAGQQTSATVVVPQVIPGVHRGEARMALSDAISADDSAYFAFEVAARARVVVVASGENGTDVEARRFAALLAPDALGPERRPYDVSLESDGWLDAADLSSVRMIVWVEPKQPAAARVERARQWCDGGGVLLAVCGPDMRGNVAGALTTLGVNMPAPSIRDRGARFVVSAQAESGMHWLQLLRGREVQRYMTLGVEPGARITLKFDDQSPAIIERDCGPGRIIWWAFSPRAEWSDLGAQAAPLLVGLHRIAAGASAGEPRAWNLSCDEPPPQTSWARGDSLVVTRVAGAGNGRERAALPGDGNATAAPAATGTLFGTQAAGLFRMDRDGMTVGACAISLRPAETDGRRLSAEDVSRALAPASAHVAAGVDSMAATLAGGAGGGSVDLEGVVWLLALLLLAAEGYVLARTGRAATA